MVLRVKGVKSLVRAIWPPLAVPSSLDPTFRALVERGETEVTMIGREQNRSGPRGVYREGGGRWPEALIKPQDWIYGEPILACGPQSGATAGDGDVHRTPTFTEASTRRLVAELHS